MFTRLRFLQRVAVAAIIPAAGMIRVGNALAAPTVTLSAAGAPSTIPGAATVSPSLLTWWGSHTAPATRFGGYYAPDSVTPIQLFPPEFLSFTHTGSVFELVGIGGGVASSPNRYRLWVDGVRVTAGPQSFAPTDGQKYLLRVDFGTMATRRILVNIDKVPIGGVNIAPGDSVSPVTPPRGPRAIFLGDSWTAGTGAKATFTGYVFSAAAKLVWRDPWASGSGGTGYCNPGPAGFNRVPFGTRLQHDVLNQAPQRIVVAGGINDQVYPAAQVQAAAASVFASIGSALPTVPLYVVGPWSASGSPSAALLRTRNAVQAAVPSGVPWIDPIGGQWITGTGHVGSPKGDGNADIYIGPDGGHPTQAGHDYIGQRLATAIAAF